MGWVGGGGEGCLTWGVRLEATEMSLRVCASFPTVAVRAESVRVCPSRNGRGRRAVGAVKGHGTCGNRPSELVLAQIKTQVERGEAAILGGDGAGVATIVVWEVLGEWIDRVHVWERTRRGVDGTEACEGRGHS